MKLWIWFSCMICLDCVIQCGALQKVWQKDTLFNNPGNWRQGRTPCPGDKAKMPDMLETPVFVENTVSLEALTLPITGSLFFDFTASINFKSNGRDKSKCGDAGEVLYNRTSRYSWYDPVSWTEDPYSISPVPHTDRIPCYHDQVQFNRPTFASMDGPPIFIRSISYGEQQLSNQELSLFLETKSGKIQMEKKTEITLTGSSCNPSEVCPCLNDIPEIIDAVCAIQRCTKPKCVKPIKPTGYCCDVCGGLVEADFGMNFTKTYLNETVSRITSDHSTIDYYISYTTKGNIEIIFTDSEMDFAKITDVANKLLTTLNEETEALGIVGPHLHLSAPDVSSSSESGSNVAVEIVVVLIILCLIYAAYYIVKKRQWSLQDVQDMLPSVPARGIPRQLLNRFQGSDTYFRFTRRLSSITSLSAGVQEMRRRWTSGSRGSHQMEETSVSFTSDSIAESSEAFANPMYTGEIPEEDPANIEPVPTAVIVDTDEPTRENPTYDLVEDMDMTVLDGPMDDIPQFDQAIPTRETGSNVCLLEESMEEEVPPEKPPRQRLEELISVDPPPLEESQAEDPSSSKLPSNEESKEEPAEAQEDGALLFPPSDLFD